MQKPLVQLAPSEEKPGLITGRELLGMGDIGPCELVEGKIIPMSPTKPAHGHYEYRIAKVIGDFAEAHQLGEVQVSEVGIYTARNPDTVRGRMLSLFPTNVLTRQRPVIIWTLRRNWLWKLCCPMTAGARCGRSYRSILALV